MLLFIALASASALPEQRASHITVPLSARKPTVAAANKVPSKPEMQGSSPLRFAATLRLRGGEDLVKQACTCMEACLARLPATFRLIPALLTVVFVHVVLLATKSMAADFVGVMVAVGVYAFGMASLLEFCAVHA